MSSLAGPRRMGHTQSSEAQPPLVRGGTRVAKSPSSSGRRSSATAGRVNTGDRVAGARAVVALNNGTDRPGRR